METVELKRCPFCGSRVKVTEIKVGIPYNDGKCADYSGTIECSCGLTFEKEWTMINSKDMCKIRDDDIFTAWNRRADDERN